MEWNWIEKRRKKRRKRRWEDEWEESISSPSCPDTITPRLIVWMSPSWRRFLSLKVFFFLFFSLEILFRRNSLILQREKEDKIPFSACVPFLDSIWMFFTSFHSNSIPCLVNERTFSNSTRMNYILNFVFLSLTPSLSLSYSLSFFLSWMNKKDWNDEN